MTFGQLVEGKLGQVLVLPTILFILVLSRIFSHFEVISFSSIHIWLSFIKLVQVCGNHPFHMLKSI